VKPDLTVLAVIFSVLLLTIIVNTLLFRPILRVMQAREDAIEQARRLAAEAEQRAAAVLAEYERRTTAARSELYGEMDATRRAALESRAELLTRTRDEANAARTHAAHQLAEATAAARSQLTAEAASLSEAIVDRVLDRKAS
jgi:F0F1-type ATP synthase membrane subunit b/b'